MNTFQPRKPAGSPTGGQFDRKPHALTGVVEMGENNYSGQTLRSVTSTSADLRKADFRGATLANYTIFEDCDVKGARFNRASIDADFTQCHMEGSVFQDADLDFTHFYRCQVGDADFSGSRIEDVRITETSMKGADLFGCAISSTTCECSTLTAINAHALKVDGLELEACEICDSDFSHARTECMCLYETNARGVNAQDAVFMYPIVRGGDLSGTQWQNAVIHGGKITDCSMRESSFEGARVHASRFVGCDFTGATFKGADFDGTKLVECTLSDAQAEELIQRGATIKPSRNCDDHE